MIYIKTSLGQSVLLNRSPELTPRQRAAFILFDGRRQLTAVLAATAGLGVTEEDIGVLKSLGLIHAALTPKRVLEKTEPVRNADGSPSINAQACYSNAYKIAARLTSDMGLRGFRLNLAVEAAMDLETLRALAPRIKESVSPEKFSELKLALFSPD